jgi:hypothetical protein
VPGPETQQVTLPLDPQVRPAERRPALHAVMPRTGRRPPYRAASGRVRLRWPAGQGLTRAGGAPSSPENRSGNSRILLHASNIVRRLRSRPIGPPTSGLSEMPDWPGAGEPPQVIDGLASPLTRA